MDIIAWLEKQGEKPNPYSGVSFEYNGHTWGMCARDNGVDISLDEQLLKHLDEKENNNSISPEEIAKSIGKSLTLSLINYLDNNRYDGAMNMSSVECEDLENSILDSDWGKVYRYMKKKLEKQGEQKSYWSEEDENLFNNLVYPEGRMDSMGARLIVEKEGLKWVPILGNRTQESFEGKSVDDILKDANGMSVVNPQTRREGLVFRSADGIHSFKAVSPEFLIKYDE